MLVEIFPINKISADTGYEAELTTADGTHINYYETIEKAEMYYKAIQCG